MMLLDQLAYPAPNIRREHEICKASLRQTFMDQARDRFGPRKGGDVGNWVLGGERFCKLGRQHAVSLTLLFRDESFRRTTKGQFVTASTRPNDREEQV